MAKRKCFVTADATTMTRANTNQFAAELRMAPSSIRGIWRTSLRPGQSLTKGRYSNVSKHDANCMRRRRAHPYVCTCGATDKEVEDAITSLQAERARRSAVPARRVRQVALIVSEFVAAHPGCTSTEIDRGAPINRFPILDGESEVDRARDEAAHAGLITSRREDGEERFYAKP